MKKEKLVHVFTLPPSTCIHPYVLVNANRPEQGLCYIRKYKDQIREVCKMRLSIVAYDWFREEGFRSTKEFMETWKRIHPRRGYVPDQTVWVHFFKKMEMTTETCLK